MIFLSKSGTKLIFKSQAGRGTVPSFESKLSTEQLNESIEFVIWSMDHVFISINYELASDINEFYPLVLYFGNNFSEIISTDGISSTRKTVFDPIKGVALFNDMDFLFVTEPDSTYNEFFDMRKEEGKGYVLYVFLENPPKNGHFIVNLKNYNRESDIEAQFQKYSSISQNPPTWGVWGEEQVNPILIEQSRKSTDTHVNASLVKLPLFIREGDKKELEILFSSNKPVYVEANIITRLGQNGVIIDKKENKKYFDSKYVYKTEILVPKIDDMPWESSSKLIFDLRNTYGYNGYDSTSFKTTVVSNYFIRLSYFIYLFLLTLALSLIYGKFLKDMDKNPILISIVLPLILVIITVFQSETLLYFSGKFNNQAPLKWLLEFLFSFAFLLLFSIFTYQTYPLLHKVSSLPSLKKEFLILFLSIPIFYINKLWLLAPMFILTMAIISHISSVILVIKNFTKIMRGKITQLKDSLRNNIKCR